MRHALPIVLLGCAACGSSEELQLAPPEGTRPFHIGFAWQPYDWSEEAFAETFRLIAEHGDMIGIYFDAFVPWQEAYDGNPYHPVQEAEIQKRLDGIQPHQKVLLGLSLLGGDRVSLSGYLGKDETPRTGPWRERTFDHPAVIEAYLKYCEDMIARFNPDYFIYVMEIDAGLTNVNDPRFKRLLAAVRQIYPSLKRRYPELPVLLEFVLQNDEETAKRAEVTRALLPYSDYYAVSTYPFLMTGGDASQIPQDWFARAKEIAPDKPFAVAETNWLAENFYHPTQGIPSPGRTDKLLIFGQENWQAQYLDFLFREARRLDAEFVLQWTVRDLDALQRILDASGGPLSSGTEPFAALATDCGLIDEDGRPRPALDVWRNWLGLPHE